MNNYANMLNDFCDYLKLSKKHHLTMIIGYNIINEYDIQRKLDLDISMDMYKLANLEEFIKTTPELLINCFIFNMDFNNFCVLNKNIILRNNNINKISKIIFDSSTFKFMLNIKMIGLFYFLMLEQDGSIYIESNNAMFTRYIINSYSELLTFNKFNNDAFHYPTGHALPKSIEKFIQSDKYDFFQSHILTSAIIYEKNISYFKKWFYGSNVELLDNHIVPYPITNERLPISKYYKITKILPHDEILSFISDNDVEYNLGLSLKTSTLTRFENN